MHSSSIQKLSYSYISFNFNCKFLYTHQSKSNNNGIMLSLREPVRTGAKVARGYFHEYF